jgi:hypothetical protein
MAKEQEFMSWGEPDSDEEEKPNPKPDHPKDPTTFKAKTKEVDDMFGEEDGEQGGDDDGSDDDEFDFM